MINDYVNPISNLLIGTQQVKKAYLGTDLVWQAYTELEYIQSDSGGGQYIDLNIQLHTTLTPNYDIDIKFNLMGMGRDNNIQATIFGCQSPTQPWPGIFIRKNNNNVQMKKSSNVNIGTLNTDIRVTGITQYNTQNLTHNYSTSLFCALNTDNTPYRYCEGRIYYFKLWNDGSLVRDMIPCKRYDGVIGMYDKVNDVFYTTLNQYPFIGGPVVNS